MDTVWEQLLLVFALSLVNAAFAGTEIALISLRDGQIPRLEERGGTAARSHAWRATPTSSWPPSRSASRWPTCWRRRPRR